MSFGLAKTLAGASNLSEIVELQAAYWRSNSMHSRPKPMKLTMADSGFARPRPRRRAASSSIRNKTSKKAPSNAQEAPNKEHSPAARDRAEGQRRDTQELGEPPVAASTVVRLMKDNPRPEKGCSGRRAYSAKPSGRKIANQSGGHAQPHIAEPTKRIATMINAVVMVGSHPHRAAIWT